MWFPFCFFFSTSISTSFGRLPIIVPSSCHFWVLMRGPRAFEVLVSSRLVRVKLRMRLEWPDHIILSFCIRIMHTSSSSFVSRIPSISLLRGLTECSMGLLTWVFTPWKQAKRFDFWDPMSTSRVPHASKLYYARCKVDRSLEYSNTRSITDPPACMHKTGKSVRVL